MSIASSANAQTLMSCEAYPQFLQQSSIARQNRNWEEMVRLGRQFLDGCPNATPVLLMQALGNLAIGSYYEARYSEAITFADRCLEHDKTALICTAIRGLSNSQLAHYASARFDLEYVADSDPGNEKHLQPWIELARSELPRINAKDPAAPVRISLPSRVSLAIPRNWTVAGPDEKRYVLTRIQGTLDLAQTSIRDPSRGVLLMARSPGSEGYASVSITIQSTNLRPSDVSRMSSEDIKRWGNESKDGIEAAMRATGDVLEKWILADRDTLADHPVLVKRYIRHGDSAGPVVVGQMQFHNAPTLITISISAMERELQRWEPVAHTIVRSIRIE
jgi:hypothetical protein